MAAYASAASLASAYVRTRLPASRLGPLVIALLLASLAGEPVPGLATLLRRIGLAVSLVLQCRIWDDLVDRERDRQRHPDRVLVSAGRLESIHALLGAAVAASVALLAWGPHPAPRLLVWGLLALGLGLWYGAGRRRWPHPVVHYHVVLAKYPVFVYLLGGATGRPLPRLSAALSVYFALCVYEVLHDPETTAAPGARRALRMAVVGLLAASVLLAASLVWEVPA